MAALLPLVPTGHGAAAANAANAANANAAGAARYFALLEVHRPTRAITVEASPSLRAWLARRVVADDVAFLVPPTHMLNAQHRMRGHLRQRGGEVHFPVYRLLGEMACAGYSLVATTATEHRDAYVFAAARDVPEETAAAAARSS